MDIAAAKIAIPDSMLAKVDAAHTEALQQEQKRWGESNPYQPGESAGTVTQAVKPGVAAIISSVGTEEYLPSRLFDGLKARGLQPVIVDPTTAARVGAGLIDTGDGTPIHIDAAVTRIVPDENIDLIKQLEQDGVPVVNGSHVQHTLASKTRMRAAFSAANVLSTESQPVRTGEDLAKAAADYGYPFVVKPDTGREGYGVEKVANENDLTKLSGTLNAAQGADLIAEPFVTTSTTVPAHSDTRVMMVGDKIFSYMERDPQGDEWRSNMAQGAKARALTELPQGMADLALAAHKAVGADISGADIYTRDKPDGSGVYYQIGEINRAPHLMDGMLPGLPGGSDAVAELVAQRYNQAQQAS